ncbi:phosphomannomutase [Tilletiaria anomala UBC 951]|uniref:Phosphomannomutase n=1 Tax=Tilletiaria anomala (strain ATCC 24038 / CBS 436.72 / UBC 951) TaxID=1037660 RepID=A0A066W7Q0_TILAU|nr:phosphomannomutase [Tilletiaria anomala UBC 951]KDN46790.1 phosphomannomutase [Tilletiaria anomala UBC 951]
MSTISKDASQLTALVAALSANARPIAQRKHPRTLCLFDVDDTLTPARQQASLEVLSLLVELKCEHCAVGFVGGSDLGKITEQLEVPGGPEVRSLFDYGFAENGLTAFAHGKDLPPQSFIRWIGEDKYQKLAKFCLRYISELDIPIMRGTFIEFRNGMINVSPIGRNATIAERHAFQEYDKQAGVRSKFVTALQREFGDWGLRFSVGGQISFDVFPQGWDKTYALRRLTEETQAKGANAAASAGKASVDDSVPGWDEVHFFGDKAFEGGNDFEIYSDKRTIGHRVTSPVDTMRQVKEIFSL